MKQMKINSDSIIDIEFDGVAKLLNPIVFKEGNSYCCILGADPQIGVFGCGDTPQDAVNDWDNNLKEHLSKSDSDDEVVAYVKETLAAIPKVIPPHVQEFYDQFRPVDKSRIKRNNL
jgi:hypothetical protein